MPLSTWLVFAFFFVAMVLATVLFVSGGLSVYLLGWLAMATPFLRRASSATPDRRIGRRHALFVAILLAITRATSGLGLFHLQARIGSIESRNTWQGVVAFELLSWTEPVFLALVAAALIYATGAPLRRALGAAALLELLSAGLAAVGSPVRWVVESAVTSTVDPAPALVAPGLRVVRWDGEGCAIDDRGALWVGGRQPYAGRFVAVEGCCGLRDDGSVSCEHGPDLFLEDDVRRLATRDLALRDDGTIACNAWLSPECALYDGLRVADFDAGEFQACWLDASGRPECRNRTTGDDRLLREPPGPFRTLAVGTGVACGLRPDGTAQCWGNVGCWSPTPRTPFASIRVGEGEACGLRADGTAACWGVPGRPPVERGPWTDLRPGRWQRTGVLAGGTTVSRPLPPGCG